MHQYLLGILLVVISAIMHMYWNILIKKCINKVCAMWLFLFWGVVIFAPISCFYWNDFKLLTAQEIGFSFLSGFLKAVYFYMLAMLYMRQDFSKAYPVARSAHVFVPFLAFIFLGEAIRFHVVAGALLLWIGIFIVHMEKLNLENVMITLKELKGKNFLYGIFTAFVVALYSVVDTAAVGSMNPLLFLLFMFFISLMFFSLHVWRRFTFSEIKEEWRASRPLILGISTLNFSGYLLVLIAMTMISVSAVVSIRQFSIVIGVIAGNRIFKEESMVPRLSGALLIVAGIIVVSVM